MNIIQARIDGQRFFLSEDHDLTALKQQIVTAVREGADFVEFESIGRGSISVLITPTIPVRFETISRTDEQVDEWEHNPPPIDTHLDMDEYLKQYGS